MRCARLVSSPKLQLTIPFCFITRCHSNLSICFLLQTISLLCPAWKSKVMPQSQSPGISLKPLELRGALQVLFMHFLAKRVSMLMADFLTGCTNFVSGCIHIEQSMRRRCTHGHAYECTKLILSWRKGLMRGSSWAPNTG